MIKHYLKMVKKYTYLSCKMEPNAKNNIDIEVKIRKLDRLFSLIFTNKTELKLNDRCKASITTQNHHRKKDEELMQ